MRGIPSSSSSIATHIQDHLHHEQTHQNVAATVPVKRFLGVLCLEDRRKGLWNDWRQQHIHYLKSYKDTQAEIPLSDFHYGDVIMSTMASQITSLTITQSYRWFGCRSKKTSKLRVTGLCAGNSPGTGEFPAQMASYAENVSIWWRHHVKKLYIFLLTSVQIVSYNMSTLVMESHIATLLVNTTHAIFTYACFNSYPLDKMSVISHLYSSF